MTPDTGYRYRLDGEGIDSPDVAAICDDRVAWCCDDLAGELVADGYQVELAELHVLAALARQLQRRLPEAVRRARAAWPGTTSPWCWASPPRPCAAATAAMPMGRKEAPSTPDPTSA